MLHCMSLLTVLIYIILVLQSTNAPGQELLLNGAKEPVVCTDIAW